MLRAGELRHALNLIEPVDTTDAAGERIRGYRRVLPHTIFANIRTGSAREALRNGAVEGQSTHTIRIRYNEYVTRKCLLELTSDSANADGPNPIYTPTGRLFAIDGIIDVDERHIEMQILAHEVTS